MSGKSVWRKEAKLRKQRGKNIEQKHKTTMSSQKGLMKKTTKIESWKGKHKKRNIKEGFWRKGFWGNKRAKHLSNCRAYILCITDSTTVKKKKHQNCKENGIHVIIWKQDNKHTKNKRKTNKHRGTQMKKTQIIQTSTTTNQTAKNKNKLSLKRGSQGNVCKGKKQKLRKLRDK